VCVCVCVCGGYFESIPNVDQKTQRKGPSLDAGHESPCAFLTSLFLTSSHLQPLIYSQTCHQALDFVVVALTGNTGASVDCVWGKKKKLITCSYGELIKYCHWVCGDKGKRRAERRVLTEVI